MAEYIELDRACKEVERFIGYLDEDMINRIKIALKRIPVKRDGINWQFCKDPNEINDAIRTQDENWEGLVSASQIINITFHPSHNCYMVFWKA